MDWYVFPRAGNRPVSEANTAGVLEILSPIWHVKAATAREVHQRIRSVFEWAIETVWAPQPQPAVRLALELQVLTAARSGEVPLATWNEMDVAGRVRTVSALRVKAKRKHWVPLCGRALGMLGAARALRDSNRLVFPMRSERPISPPTLPRMLQGHRDAAVGRQARPTDEIRGVEAPAPQPCTEIDSGRSGASTILVFLEAGTSPDRSAGSSMPRESPRSG